MTIESEESNFVMRERFHHEEAVIESIVQANYEQFKSIMRAKQLNKIVIRKEQGGIVPEDENGIKRDQSLVKLEMRFE